MSACKLDVLKHSFLYTFQPPYLHYRCTSIECSNCMGRAFGLCKRRMAITGIRTHHCSQKQNRQIKIRQLELETNPPNLIPAEFSGHTVYSPDPPLLLGEGSGNETITTSVLNHILSDGHVQFICEGNRSSC